MKYFKKLSYHKKIFLGMLFVAILPILIYYVASTQVFRIYYLNNLTQEAKEVLELTDEELTKSFGEIFEGLDAITINPQILNGLMGEEISETPEMYRQLYLVAKKHWNMAEFCVYDSKGRLVTSLSDEQEIKSKLATDWGVLFEAGGEPGKCIVRNAKDYYGTQKDEYLRVAEAITDSDDNIMGYAVAVVTDSHFDKILNNVGLEKRGVIHILDNFDEPIYASMAVADEDEYRQAQKELLRNDYQYYDGESLEYRYYAQKVDELGMSVIFRQEVATHIMIQRNLRLFGAIIGIVGIIMCLVMSRYFAGRFYSPIEKIQGTIRKISSGDYTVRVSTDSEDELSLLAEDVNSMAETLANHTQQLIERERELGETNIKMMNAQLNPHFIYNTLDTMKWIGKINDVPEVATISSGLAQILRTSISSNQLVKLSEELSLVEAYVEIQKIRFDDKFEFVIDIPEELVELSVPKLILQPIIENAIVHGFEDREHGQILVTGYREGDILYLKVKDDGCGIDYDTLKILNEHQRDTRLRHTSIGFFNVHRIIQLHFGEEYGLAIGSDEQGTEVTYRLPVT